MKVFYTALFVLISIEIFSQPTFDIEGHRGARGLYPENTITAFIEAVKLGVNTLEMDVVVSKDNQLVVSHEPWFNTDICSTPNGKSVEGKINLYQLTYDEIKKYDCGSRGNPKFPEQKKISERKPLLSEVIDTVESYIRTHHLPSVQYNIETKTTPEGDNVEHPAPNEFVNLIYALLKQKNILNNCIIQSFDVRTLQVLRKTDAAVTTALLIFDADSFKKNLKQLGFIPEIYSPNFILVNKKLVSKCRAKKVKLIPWTVNDEDKMLQMKQLGCDGLITDYPDRAIKILREKM